MHTLKTVVIGLLAAVLGFWLLVQWQQYQAVQQNLGVVLQLLQLNIQHGHLEALTPAAAPATAAPAAPVPAPAPTPAATPATSPPAKPKG